MQPNDPAQSREVESLVAESGSLGGQRLGSLEVKSLIGSGGMGHVYRALDSKLKREVAIKVLPLEFMRDAERVARFQREAEVLASLNHPHIAAITISRSTVSRMRPKHLGHSRTSTAHTRFISSAQV